MKIRFFQVLLLSLITFSCTRNNEPEPDLSAVYFAGHETLGLMGKPVYWNNNAKTELPLGNNAVDGYAKSISVKGNDIYVAGEETYSNMNTQPLLWKNGVRTVLPIVHARGWSNDVFVNGTDVYVAGHEQLDPVRLSLPVLWKNGVRTQLTADTLGGLAVSVFVNGTDVYVAGTIINSAGQGVPAYWKNGNLVLLNNNIQGGATGIAITGNDLYISGYEFESPVWTPVYWKNGVKTKLPTASAAAEGLGYDIKLNDGAVYVTGVEYTNGNPYSKAIVWKDGVRINLAAPSETVVKANAIHFASTNKIVAGSQNNYPAFWVNGIKKTIEANPGEIKAVTVRQ